LKPNLVGSAPEHFDQLPRGPDQQVTGFGQGDAPRRVDYVRGGQAVVDPLGRVAPDAIGDHVDEGGYVVVGNQLPFGHRGHRGVIHDRCAFPDLLGLGRGDDAEFGPRLDRQHFDLQPGGQLGGIAEQRRHLGPGVSGDHDAAHCRR